MGARPDPLTASEEFRLLLLCTRPPGAVPAFPEFCALLATPRSWATLLESAEYHGVECLLLAHARGAGIEVPSAVLERLRARWVQHSHASEVRTRVVSDVVRALDQAGVPLLFLKGAALARLVYADPILRPMRDVDVLVKKQDAHHAWDVLQRLGLRPSGESVGEGHHHLQGLSTTIDGATVTIEIHHELFARSPFVEALRYDDVCGDSQEFKWGGMTLRTLGSIDLLWHAYAHAFVINTFCRGIRLSSVADLVHGTETWGEALDWESAERRYGRMVRALSYLGHVMPWSPRLPERLRCRASRKVSGVRPIEAPLEWWGAIHRDVLWPPPWWFGMRYGIVGRLPWFWYRLAGHPARLVAAAASAGRRRISARQRYDGARTG